MEKSAVFKSEGYKSFLQVFTSNLTFFSMFFFSAKKMCTNSAKTCPQNILRNCKNVSWYLYRTQAEQYLYGGKKRVEKKTNWWFGYVPKQWNNNHIKKNRFRIIMWYFCTSQNQTDVWYTIWILSCHFRLTYTNM